MAHAEQRRFFRGLKETFPQYFTDVSVVEIGSLNVNGTIRDFFDAKVYFGVDVGPGPGVDFVVAGQDVNNPDNSFDVAVSAECFEHNPEWVATFANMVRLADKFVVVTCASDGRPEHGTTRTTPSDSPHTVEWDYYRNLNEADFREQFDFDDLFSSYEFSYNADSKDLYFWGEL